MTVHYRRHHLEELLTSARTIVDRLTTDLDALIARATETPDGYPRSSMRLDASRSSELDEDGHPLPPRSDPVADTVVLRNDPTRTNDALIALQHLHHAIGHLDKADGARARALPPEPPTDPDELWCTSCLRINVTNGRGNPKRQGKNTELCSWCHDWKAEHDELPPKLVLERRHRGERITDRVVAEAQAAEARDRQRRKKPRR